MKKNKFDNAVVIVVMDRTTSPRTILGCVSHIKVKNQKDGFAEVGFRWHPDPRKGIHFKFIHASIVFINYLCSSSNPQFNQYEFCFSNYKDIYERYLEAKNEKNEESQNEKCDNK